MYDGPNVSTGRPANINDKVEPSRFDSVTDEMSEIIVNSVLQSLESSCDKLFLETREKARAKISKILSVK